MRKLWIAILGVALVVGFAASPASAAQTQLQGTWTGTVTVSGWQQVLDGSGNQVWCPSTVTLDGVLQEPYLGTGSFQISFGVCAQTNGSFTLTTNKGTIAPYDNELTGPQAAIFNVNQQTGQYFAITGAPCTLPLGGTGAFANIVGSSYHYDPKVPPNPAYGYCVPGSYIYFELTGVFAQMDHVPNASIGWQGAVTGTIVTAELPATKDACKNAGWQHLTDTRGNPFKNQGDCVSFVATGGKNVARG